MRRIRQAAAPGVERLRQLRCLLRAASQRTLHMVICLAPYERRLGCTWSCQTIEIHHSFDLVGAYLQLFICPDPSLQMQSSQSGLPVRARSALRALGGGAAPWAAPSDDWAPLRAPGAPPLALARILHAGVLALDERGARSLPSRTREGFGSAAAPAPGLALAPAGAGAPAARPRRRGFASAAAPGAARAATPAAALPGPTAAPAPAPVRRAFVAARPFVVAVTHVASGANVLLARVAEPLAWSEYTGGA